MLTFKNDGLIPVEGFTTMGINVKVGDGPIGHFGTGLKISIANILRAGGAITIWRGLSPHEFGVIRKTIRGKDFDIVTMNGQELGFTTELGKNWKSWMTMRELESNCRDEGGVSKIGRLEPSEGTTTIHVTEVGVQDAYMNIEDYFICGVPLERIEQGCEFYDKPSKFFFLRGIRVGEFPQVLPFTVNFRHDARHSLTEDRTISEVYVRSHLVNSLLKLKSIQVLEAAFPLEWQEGSYLHELDYDVMYPSLTPEGMEFFKSRYMTSMLSLSHKMTRMLFREGVLIDNGNNDASSPMSGIEEKMVETAIQYLVDLGYPENIIRNKKIIKGATGSNVYAFADRIKHRIVLGQTCFDMGQKFLCTTLHEEMLHLVYNLPDESRAFQDHVLNRLATVMEQYHYDRPL